MAVVDTLVTRYKMDNQDYVRGAEESVRHTNLLANAVRGAITAYAAFGAAFIGLGVLASKQAAQFDAMVKALEAIEGGADKAQSAIKELRKIAAQPGLGFQEAVQGYSSLRRSGMDRDQSMRILNATGNANALAGGGRDELSRILQALTKIQYTGKLQGDELNLLAEAGIAAPGFVKDKFGTTDSVQLQKMGVDAAMAIEAIVEGMEKLPKAAASAKNSWENLMMGIENAIVSVGTSLNAGFMKHIDSFVEVIEKADEAGAFKAFGDAIVKLVEELLPKGATQFDTMKTVLKETLIAVYSLTLGFIELSKRMEETFGFILRLFDDEPNNLWGEKAKEGPKFEGITGKIDDFRQTMDKIFSQIESGAPSSPAIFQPGYKPPKEVDPAAAKQTDLLDRIAVNTDKMVEIQSAFIGGSIRGSDRFNAVNINRFSPTVGDPWAQAVGAIRVAALSEIGAQFRYSG